MILNETFCALFRGYLAPVVRHFITLNLFLLCIAVFYPVIIALH